MTSVVICSASEDRAQAEAIAEALSAAGYATWRDDTPSDDFWGGDAVVEQIGRAKAAIVLWSRASAASALFRAQANAARQQRKLVQVSADGTPPPFPFHEAPAADLSHWEGQPRHSEWKQILDRVRSLAGGAAPESAPSPLPNFPGWLRPNLRLALPITSSLKAGFAASIALLTAAAASGLASSDSEPAAPRTASASVAPVATPARIRPAPAAAARPAPEPVALAAADIPPPPAIGAKDGEQAETEKRAPASSASRQRKESESKTEAAKRLKRLARASAARPRIKYRYSDNMRLFCEGAGRTTPECRIFRRNAPKKRNASRAA